jgi:hypothetical protein
MDITDNIYANEDIHQILIFTDNMPLAVNLIAHLSEYEDLSNVLTRLEAEKTALLSAGYDRRSNLDASISLSVSSPRITSDSKELLKLLSILPDGLADAELVQINLPIPNILSCKATLLATSLAYQDTNKRLRSLMPVREHVQQFLPPSPSLIQSLRNCFHTLLELYQEYNGDQLHPVVNEITLNPRNLHNVLQCGLHDKAPDVTETILSIISLNLFYRITRGNGTVLMNHLQPIFHGLGNSSLKIHFITEVLGSANLHCISDPMQSITEAITLFCTNQQPLS